MHQIRTPAILRVFRECCRLAVIPFFSQRNTFRVIFSQIPGSVHARWSSGYAQPHGHRHHGTPVSVKTIIVCGISPFHYNYCMCCNLSHLVMSYLPSYCVVYLFRLVLSYLPSYCVLYLFRLVLSYLPSYSKCVLYLSRLVLSYLPSYYVVYLFRLVLFYLPSYCVLYLSRLVLSYLPSYFSVYLSRLVMSYLPSYYVVYLSVLSCLTYRLTMLHTCLSCLVLPAVLLCCVPVHLVLCYLPSYYVVYLSVLYCPNCRLTMLYTCPVLSCPTYRLSVLYTCLSCLVLPAVLLCCIPVCLVLSYLPSYYVVYLSRLVLSYLPCYCVLYRSRLVMSYLPSYCVLYLSFLSCPTFFFFFRWCLMSSDVGWHIRDKLRPMREHGSI